MAQKLYNKHCQLIINIIQHHKILVLEIKHKILTLFKQIMEYFNSNGEPHMYMHMHIPTVIVITVTI
jgi:hypothetical protein